MKTRDVFAMPLEQLNRAVAVYVFGLSEEVLSALPRMAQGFTSDWNNAMDVAAAVRCRCLFSQRRRFFTALIAQGGKHAEHGFVVWPDLFLFLTPEAVCRAAVIAVATEDNFGLPEPGSDPEAEERARRHLARLDVPCQVVEVDYRGRKCENPFRECDRTATTTAAAGRGRSQRILACCEGCVTQVADRGDDRTESCPNCDCHFGVSL